MEKIQLQLFLLLSTKSNYVLSGEMLFARLNIMTSTLLENISWWFVIQFNLINISWINFNSIYIYSTSFVFTYLHFILSIMFNSGRISIFICYNLYMFARM